MSWFRQTLLTCLKNLQDANGLGLKAVTGEDYCRVVIQYPSDTVSKWVSSFPCCVKQSFYLIQAGLSPFQPYGSACKVHLFLCLPSILYAFETLLHVWPANIVLCRPPLVTRVYDHFLQLLSWTNFLQRDPITHKVEGLSFEFNLCEAVASWEQVIILRIHKSM